MSHGHAECTACEHTWELRKPHAEIDMLRCSACGATSDSITVTEPLSETATPDDLSIVERVQLEERQIELQKRTRQLQTHIEQLGDGSVSAELDATYTALETLASELSSDELVAAGELDEIAAYLEEKEAEIDTKEVVTELTTLEVRVEELTEEVKELEARKRELKEFIAQGKSLTGSE